jgi:hypothetical protein
VSKYPFRSRRTQKKPAFVVDPEDKLHFIAALPHTTAPTCEATLDVEVKDQTGMVFAIEHELLHKGKPLLIVAEDVESEPVASRLSEPRVLSTAVTAAFDGCTATEALEFEAVFVIDSGDGTAIRTEELALSFESLEEAGMPPVYPALGFPPGLFRGDGQR